MHQTTKERGAHSSPSFLNVAARADLGVDSELQSLPSNRGERSDALRYLGTSGRRVMRRQRCHARVADSVIPLLSKVKPVFARLGPAYRTAASDWLVCSNLQLAVGAAATY
jgi:hypothetical protein